MGVWVGWCRLVVVERRLRGARVVCSIVGSVGNREAELELTSGAIRESANFTSQIWGT